MKRNPFRKRVLVWFLAVFVLYGSVGFVLRVTGFLHPYWGKYLVLRSPGEDGFSRLLARDPVITRPLYLLECLDSLG